MKQTTCDRVVLRISCDECGYPYSEACYDEHDFPSVKHTETRSNMVGMTADELKLYKKE